MSDKEQQQFKTSLVVTGMTCATCSRMVERSLGKVGGVVFAAVNLATETAFVVSDREIPKEELVQAVEKAGYSVSEERAEDLEKNRYLKIKKNLALSWLVTAPLMTLMVFHMIGQHVPLYYPLEVFGGALAIFWAGRDSIKGAWIALSHFHANMDVLVVSGSVAAWATAAFAFAGFPVVSFGAVGAMIMALHITGRYIESRLRDKASKEIRALLSIQAREARVLDGEEKEIMIPIEAVKEGMTLLVKPGERLPSDGELLDGTTSVDESMITGESLPVVKNAGDGVTGGSLNLTGAVRIRATRVGEDSFLAQMVSLIQEAQGAKVPIQAFADRVTNYFVPGVATLAVISGVFWYLQAGRLAPFLDGAARFLPWVTSLRDPLSLSIFAFITTIVIACPCALGLATPMALITGTGAASKKGLIIRNAEAIQTARAVAARVGITEVRAGVRPDGKLDLVRNLQSRGGKVLMTGDGMNDAAALKGADIGVAIGSGTDLAIDSADIVIVKGGISRLADAVAISRKTFTVIRQNLFWAFAYNVIAIPLAMGALLHPVIAEGAMAFSSISVILNSMRVK